MWKVKMEASGAPNLSSGRGWPKESKSVQLTGEPLRFAYTPFVVDLNTIHRQEKGAYPVAAGLGGEESLLKCQWSHIGWWTIRGSRNIAWHIQVANPQDFHGFVFLKELALFQPGA